MTRLLCRLFGHDPVAGLPGELVCRRCFTRTEVAS